MVVCTYNLTVPTAVCTYNLTVPTAVCSVCAGTFEADGRRQMLTNCGRESHYMPLSILACPEWLYGSR